MSRKIVFLNYNQLPFSNTAHSTCFTNLFYRFVDYYLDKAHNLPQLEIYCLGLSIRKDEMQSSNSNFGYFIAHYSDKVKYNLYEKKFQNNNQKSNVFFGILEFIRSCWILRRYLVKNKINTVFCYSDAAFYIILLSLTLKVKFYFDCKGDRISELKFDGRSQIFIKINSIYQNFLLKNTSKVFITSTKLKDLFQNYCKKAKFIHNTNYYDDRHIKWEQKTSSSKSIRFVYSGSTVKYQMFDDTLLLFKKYHDSFPNSELILLIRDDHQKVMQKINQLGLDTLAVSLYFARSLTELNAYLNTCDIAIMLRNSDLINYYAFPTKFAEYLAAGLPVITTDGVYDTYNIISKNNLGIIINPNNNLGEEVLKIHSFIKTENPNLKKNCAKYALENLSWSNNIERIFYEIIE